MRRGLGGSKRVGLESGGHCMQSAFLPRAEDVFTDNPAEEQAGVSVSPTETVTYDTVLLGMRDSRTGRSRSVRLVFQSVSESRGGR